MMAVSIQRLEAVVTSTTPRRDPSSTPASGSTVGAPRRVVIAEDEASARADLAQLLTAEGFTVVGQAADGYQAVALATALRPDLVLMNARLPHTDGITATATLTAARIAPVVILTGAGQPPAAPRARDAGAMTAVRRPFSRANLLPAIEMSIARYAETAALREQVADLTQRLAARKVVERAKGLVMAQRETTEPDAFRWLQRTAAERRTSILQVAAASIDNHNTATAADPTTRRTGPSTSTTGVPTVPARAGGRRARPRPEPAAAAPAAVGIHRPGGADD
jgi:response regulator NasT